MPKGTLSGLVARMEKMGLIERRQCPDDGRAQRVRLTRKARAIEPNLRARHSEAMAVLQAGLTDGEVAQLTALLRRVLENLRANEDTMRGERRPVPGAADFRVSRRQSVSRSNLTHHPRNTLKS
jgi:hypothetical protein